MKISMEIIPALLKTTILHLYLNQVTNIKPAIISLFEFYQSSPRCFKRSWQNSSRLILTPKFHSALNAILFLESIIQWRPLAVFIFGKIKANVHHGERWGPDLLDLLTIMRYPWMNWVALTSSTNIKLSKIVVIRLISASPIK